MKVIRIVQYEGTEDAVRDAIARSLPLGIKYSTDYTVTIAEHLNELPPILVLPPEEVAHTIKTQKLISIIEN